MGGNINKKMKRSLQAQMGVNIPGNYTRLGPGGRFGNQMQGGFNPGGQMQQPILSQPAYDPQIGTGAPVADASQSFVQASLGSKKGDATYDAFSDFNKDGFVNTSDFGEYMRANPGGQASMVESQQVLDNRQDQIQSLTDQRQSLMEQMRQMNQGLGMSGMGYGMPRQPIPQWSNRHLNQFARGNPFNSYGSYGPAYRGAPMYRGLGGYFGGYKDGGLIKGYQDGGEMMDPRLEEVSMMEEETIQTPSGTDTEMLRIVLEAKAALEGRHPNPEDALEKFVEAFGEDELMSLKEHVIRSMESGIDNFRSDGMSDSIPGNIDGMEQVALSEGEYVVPADVVSGLGNGDTGSGARELRNLIGRVRGLRNGSTQQPPAIDPSMMMPV